MRCGRACCCGWDALPGALEENDYRSKLVGAGFADVSFEETRTYDIEDARVFLTEAGIAVDEIAEQVPRQIS